jgi:hypothetical protein
MLLPGTAQLRAEGSHYIQRPVQAVITPRMITQVLCTLLPTHHAKSHSLLLRCLCAMHIIKANFVSAQDSDVETSYLGTSCTGSELRSSSGCNEQAMLPITETLISELLEPV